MDFWNVLEYAAWGISAGLMLWMLIDALRVGAEYDADALISSREGSDELLEFEAPTP
jgi:hypothetical protein